MVKYMVKIGIFVCVKGTLYILIPTSLPYFGFYPHPLPITVTPLLRCLGRCTTLAGLDLPNMWATVWGTLKW